MLVGGGNRDKNNKLSFEQDDDTLMGMIHEMVSSLFEWMKKDTSSTTKFTVWVLSVEMYLKKY